MATDDLDQFGSDAEPLAVQQFGEFDQLLEKLKTARDDHFGFYPDHLTYGEAGTLAEVNRQMRQILAFVNA